MIYSSPLLALGSASSFMKFFQTIATTIAAAALVLATPAAQAQLYPSHPVRIVVPTVAGGAVDVVTRIVTTQLGNTLGANILSSASAQGIACNAPAKPMLQVELMFGRNIGGRLGVGEAAWSRFLAHELTPRFPDGLAVLDAAGQWQDKARGRVVHEPSKLVMIVTADDAEARDKIAAIAEAYKEKFHQQSVGIVTRAVCAAF